MNTWLLIPAIILGAGSLFLIAYPDKAETARRRFAGWGNSCFQGMPGLLKHLPDIWRRTDIIPALQSRRDEVIDYLTNKAAERRIANEERRVRKIEKLNQRIAKASGQPNPQPPMVDHAKIEAEARASAEDTFKASSSPQTVANFSFAAWMRILGYCASLLVLYVTEISIVMLRLNRVGLLIIPDWLFPFLNNLFLLIAPVFIASILLAELAREETADKVSVPELTKLSPFDSDTKRVYRKVLPWVIIALSIVNTVLLIYASLSPSTGPNSKTLHAYEYFLFLGLSTLALIGGILGSPAILALAKLVLLTVGGLLWAVCALIAGVISYNVAAIIFVPEFVGQFLRRIWWRVTRKRDNIPETKFVEAGGDMLLGIGSEGTDLVAEIGSVVRALNQPFQTYPLLYVDVYSQDEDQHSKALDRLHGLAPLSFGLSADKNLDVRQTLRGALADAHPLVSVTTATVICVTSGKDLRLCLPVLQQHEKDIIKANQGNSENPIRFILIWRLPQGADQDPEVIQMTRELETWAKAPGSRLAGTILIRDDSPLMAPSDGSTLVARAVASFIMSGRYQNGLPLEKLAQQMAGSQSPFFGLAAGTKGIRNVVLTFENERHGVIDESYTAVRLQDLMAGYAAGELTSVPIGPKPTDRAKFAIVISPESGNLRNEVNKWLINPYNVPADDVAVIPVDLLPNVDLSRAASDYDSGGAHPQLSVIYSLDGNAAVP